MTRRELLRLGGSTVLFAGLTPLSKLSANHHKSGQVRLFFNESEIPRIRANAKTPLIKPLYDKWAASSPSVLTEAMAKFNETGEIIRDLMTAMRAMAIAPQSTSSNRPRSASKVSSTPSKS